MGLMTNIESYRISTPFFGKGGLDQELEHNKMYYLEAILDNIHKHLPYAVPIKSFPHSTIVEYKKLKADIQAFMQNIGDPMFSYWTPAMSENAYYIFNAHATWSIHVHRIWVKDPRMISTLKLAFG
jgi:hypothetical protein